MGEPCLAGQGISRRGKPVGEAYPRGIGVRIRQGCETLRRAVEVIKLRLQRPACPAERLLRVRIAPLDHIIILGSHDVKPVKEPSLGQHLQISHVMGREGGRQLDHHPTLRQGHINRFRRIDGPPVPRRGRVKDRLERRRRRGLGPGWRA